MGQGQSKTTSGQDANKDQSQPHAETNSDVGSMPDASSATAPSLGTKLFQMFSKTDNVPADIQPHSATYKSPYAPASPFPPSSSTLAQSFRNELTGGSPVQSKPNSSSFFLGKVLISPRRPLREYKRSTCTEVTSPLVTSSVGFHPKGSGKETPNYNLPTPKSLKRKAQSPEYGNRNKSLRLERTASPALKDSFLAGTRAAHVEEQEEVVGTELLSVPPAETKNHNDMIDNFEVASHETDICVRDVNCVDKVDNRVAISCDEGVEKNDDHPVSDTNNLSSHERLIDESSMTAPYSPSQQPKSLMSVIDISLSSMISCASPGTLLFRRDSTHDDLDMSDAEVNDSNVTTKSLDGTVLQKLKDLKEYFLPAADTNTSQSNNVVIDSAHNSSVADNTLLEEPRSLPAAPDDNAVDMNGESRIELMEVCPNETASSFEASDHGDHQPHIAVGHDPSTRDFSVGSVLGSTGGTCTNVSLGYNGNSSAGECSETSTSSERRNQDDLDENTLPSAGTTNCSTISNKQWLSVFKMTESKDKCDDGDESSGKRRDTKTSKAYETAHMRPRCSEDAYYHYAPARSTFTSSVSNMRWPYLSISTSSASALGISTVSLFKSLPFFDSSLKDDSTSSSQEAEFTGEAKTVAAETSNANIDVTVSPCETRMCALPSTNGSVDLEIAGASVEEQRNDEHDDANVVNMIEKENNRSTKNNVDLNLTSSATDHSGLRIPSEQHTLTPKRSTRIASRLPTTPNSSLKSRSTRNNSTQDSSAVSVLEETFLSTATPVTADRQRRRRRSPSTDSNASKQSASRSLLDLSPRRQKKRRSGGSRDASLQELTDQAHVTPQDETQPPRIIDVDVSGNNSLEISKGSYSSTMVNDLTGPSEKSSAPRSKKARTEAALQRNVAVLREESSADYITNSQVLMLVRPANSSNSGALMRQLRLQFPQASFVSTAAGGHQHKKKKRAGSDSSRQVERSIMEGRSPIIVEAARGVSVVPFLFLAHSANYNTLFYNEDRYLNILPKKNVSPCLPFCYSWFMNLTDSVELARAGKQFLSGLLAVPACLQDLTARTQYQGSVAELLSSYIPNNIVGGPEILHCTAKGGASSDPAYSAKPEVMEAVGSTTTLLIVGFVLTPRTFGARVKLTPEQLLIWGNSDEPSVPKEIGQLFADQEDITAEKGALVGSSDAETEGNLFSFKENGSESSRDTVDSPALNQKTKRSIKMVPLDGDCEVFCPTSGPGSRAHITLGCFSSDVHPRTAGFDLLKVVEKEQQAKKKSADGGTKNRTTIEESDHESDTEVEGESSVIHKTAPSVAQSESSKADDSLIPMSSSNEEGSSGPASISVGGDITKGDGVTSSQSDSDGIAASVRVEGATVRCYGDGVWVVYPDQVFKVTAMFSGFHNSD